MMSHGTVGAVPRTTRRSLGSKLSRAPAGARHEEGADVTPKQAIIAKLQPRLYGDVDAVLQALDDAGFAIVRKPELDDPRQASGGVVEDGPGFDPVE